MKNIVVFASGSGSNALKLAKSLEGNTSIRIAACFCNNKNAAVIEKMNNRNIPVELFNRQEFNNPEEFLTRLQAYQPELIALLGFLWLIPTWMVQAYPSKIVNLHPALLPKFGGKGMYGMHVHEAVKEAGEVESGITLHWVNEKYDEGGIIAQFKVALTASDTVESIAGKIHELEQNHVSQVLISLLLQNS